MRNQILIFVLFALLLLGCRKELPKQNRESIRDTIKSKEIVVDDANPKFSESDYQIVYQYSDGADDQILGINFAAKHTIKFHLITKTLPCDTEYWGIAENINWNMDPEIDSDENGGYFADEYFKEEQEYSLAIRIADDSSKVVIKYFQKDGLETDCLPITRKIMKRKK